MFVRVQRFSRLLQIVRFAVLTSSVAVLAEQQTISSASPVIGLKKVGRAHHTESPDAICRVSFSLTSLGLKCEQSAVGSQVASSPVPFSVQSVGSRLRGGSQNEGYDLQSAIDNAQHFSPPYDNAVDGSQPNPTRDQHGYTGGDDGIALHDGWYQYYDETEGLPYYYNVHTGVTEWEMPEQCPAAPAVATHPLHSLSEPREAVTQHAGAVSIPSITLSYSKIPHMLCAWA